MKDNVYSVHKVLYLSSVYVQENVVLINYILIEFVYVKADILEEVKHVLKMVL